MILARRIRGETADKKKGVAVMMSLELGNRMCDEEASNKPLSQAIYSIVRYRLLGR